MDRCSHKEYYERMSGILVSSHHSEVAPEEVPELHKLLQTQTVLRHRVSQLSPGLQRSLDLFPKYMHSLWAQLLQPRSLLLHLLLLLPDEFIVNLWRITVKIYQLLSKRVSLTQPVPIVSLYDYDLTPIALCILFSWSPIWSTYGLHMGLYTKVSSHCFSSF